MPYRSPKFWLEILALGFVLVVGFTILTEWLSSPWMYIARIAFAAAIFTTYASHYERTWANRA